MTSATILLRHAHPNFMDGDLPTSQVFLPNSGDEGRMSVYDGDQITASECYVDYTKVRKKLSHSVWGLSCAEVSDQGLAALPNPLPGFPAHAVVDFTGKTEKESRRIAKKLKAAAIHRGCRYLPS